MTAVETRAPLTGCLPWCTTDDPFNHYDDQGSLTGTHSRDLATGACSHHYGPIYTVSLQHDSRGKTRLWVTVETATLTADQAEVLGRALLEGAAALRASGSSVAVDNICPSYQSRRGWVDVPDSVFDPTPAEGGSQRG